jgi:hypothetical protein
MVLLNRYKSSNPLFLIVLTAISLTSISIGPSFSQDVKTNDSILICPRSPYSHSYCFNAIDTFFIKPVIDSSLCRTWYIDQLFSSLNDSIWCLFGFGIDKAYLKFGLNKSIRARGTGYGFRGSFRISIDNRILIEEAESKAVYYKKDTLNSAYQCFWDSFVPLLHESKYSICGDSLFLFFQTGSALLIDSVKVTDTYLKTKQWPSQKAEAASVDELIKGLMMDSASIPKNSLQKR